MNPTITTLAFALCWCYSMAENSILDLINTEKVEQFLLERQQNESRDISKKPTSWDTLNILPVDDEHVDENELPDINTNSVTKHIKRGKHLPDFSTVILEMSRPDKLLRSDPTTLLVTKKEYLRKDWCRTEPIIQKVREDGCNAKNFVNRFCYGQCNSFYIPKNLSHRKGKKRRIHDVEEAPAFRSCGVCKPKKTVWAHVTLHCPELNPPLRRRRVLKIKQCQCLAENINN